MKFIWVRLLKGLMGLGVGIVSPLFLLKRKKKNPDITNFNDDFPGKVSLLLLVVFNDTFLCFLPKKCITFFYIFRSYIFSFFLIYLKVENYVTPCSFFIMVIWYHIFIITISDMQQTIIKVQRCCLQVSRKTIKFVF